MGKTLQRPVAVHPESWGLYVSFQMEAVYAGILSNSGASEDNGKRVW